MWLGSLYSPSRYFLAEPVWGGVEEPEEATPGSRPRAPLSSGGRSRPAALGTWDLSEDASLLEDACQARLWPRAWAGMQACSPSPWGWHCGGWGVVWSPEDLEWEMSNRLLWLEGVCVVGGTVEKWRCDSAGLPDLFHRFFALLTFK